MAYFFGFLGLALIVLIVIKYRGAKMKHQAAANVVFAKYTYEKLSKEDRKRVEEKARKIAKTKYDSEVEQFGWYAVAMKSLGIPSAIPDNPSWYLTKHPDVLIPSEMMIRAVMTFINRNYGLDIKVGTASAFRKEEDDQEENETKKLEKPNEG